MIRWLALLLLLGPPVLAEDWTEFRGPTHQGHAKAKGLPVEWSTTKNIAWKTAIPGQGWSSPVLAGGQVYLTAAIPGADGVELAALALDAGSGAIGWQTRVYRQEANATNIHSKNSHASPTPVLEGQRLYVHFGHQGTACLDLAGKIIWSTRELAYAPRHGNGGSPIIADDLLVFSADAETDPFLAALDKATGKLRWKVARETEAAKKFSFSTPLLITVKGQRQLISAGSNVVGAYDPANGKLLWNARYEGYSVVPRPVFAQGLVIFSTGYDRAKMLAIDPTGAGDVTETHLRWTQPRGAPNTPSPLAVDDLLYVVSDGGIATCLEIATGKVVWQKRLDGDFSASPIFADGRIYIPSEAGMTHVFQPGRTFQALAKNDLEERTLASLAVGERSLFARTAGHLYKITAN